MKESYLDYAMSVIVSRALPDVKDGLKPVHRRILYSMKGLGLYHDRPFRKSASVVGEVLGKYHPHGDVAVYDALTRMVQDFSLRYPLIDGQGNFGSIDGDAAAAYRYTETKLKVISETMLEDIDKDTVTWIPNFDGKLKEPAFLPSKFPNLLVNGTSGIAVGMTTNVPPHNLSEVIDALCALIDDPELKDVTSYIKGPDFPTGGEIVGIKGIQDAYESGRGKIVIRGKVDFEERKGDRKAICITEIPYQVNKASLVEKIALLSKERKIEGISEIRDESSRKGIRIVIELKRDANEDVILNNLFKHTSLRTVYGIILLVLQDGVPKLLGLRELLVAFLNHRYDIVKRRTNFDLKNAEEHAHILEGLKIALHDIDKVIGIIREAKSHAAAMESLKKEFNLTDKQVQAILDMRLRRLVSLEREKIDEDYLLTIKLIEKLKGILASIEGIMKIVKEELLELKKKFGDKRRTTIIEMEAKEFDLKDLIPDEPVIITMTEKNYIKRLQVDAYKTQLRGGKGVSGVNLAREDAATSVYLASNHKTLLFLTDTGKCYSLKAYDIPEAERAARGKPIRNLLPIPQDEKIVSCLPLTDFNDDLFIVTKLGIAKKVHLAYFKQIRRTGIIAAKLRPKDSISYAHTIRKGEDIILISKNGRAVRFSEANVRSMGRTASGVIGMRLHEGDEIIGVITFSEKDGRDLLLVSEDGYGKRTKLSRFRRMRRGAHGVICMKGKKVAGATLVDNKSTIIIITRGGQTIGLHTKKIRKMGRQARGVRLINLKKGDIVVGIARVV